MGFGGDFFRVVVVFFFLFFFGSFGFFGWWWVCGCAIGELWIVVLCLMSFGSKYNEERERERERERGFVFREIK